MLAYFVALGIASASVFLVRSAGDFRTTPRRAVVGLILGWLVVIALVRVEYALTGGVDDGAAITFFALAGMTALQIIQVPPGTLRPRPKHASRVLATDDSSADVLGGVLG